MTTGICRDCGEHCAFTCEHEYLIDKPCECDGERLSECCGAKGHAYDHDPP